MATWKFHTRDLMSLWLENYPRLLGNLWLNDEEDRFRAEERFCREKIQQYCFFELPAGMPISIINGYQYDPYVTPQGLFLALPEKPQTKDDVFRNYLLQNRFFYLPRRGAERADMPRTSQTTSSSLPEMEDVPEDRRWKLRVSDLQKILTTIPRLITMDWLEPDQIPFHKKNDIQSILERNMESSLEGFFSKGGRIRFPDTTSSDPDPFITPEGLVYPVPPLPSDLSQIFTSFQDGTATNPSTTQCPLFSYTS